MELLAKNLVATALRLLPPPAVKLARKAGGSRITAKIRSMITLSHPAPSIVNEGLRNATLETKRLTENLVARGYGPDEVSDLLKSRGRDARPMDEVLNTERHLSRIS